MTARKIGKITIIIPTYNRGFFIVDTIESFLNQDYPDFEIIVCNNNSTDNTQDVLEAYRDRSQVRLLFEKRQGVHFARNTAGKHASGDLLYFTDDDMLATPNLLSEIVKVFELDYNVGSATGRVLPKWEVDPPAWVEKLLSNHMLSLNNPPEDLIISSYDCNVFSCHQAILREAFFQAGGFNPENVAGVWIGDGETGLNMKIKELGYKFAYIGSSVIYHRIPAHRMTQNYLNVRFRNHGRCDAYTKLREHKGEINFAREIMNELRLFWFKSKFNLNLSKREINHLRFIGPNLMYMLGKLSYYREAHRDPEIMKMVLRQNWLED